MQCKHHLEAVFLAARALFIKRAAFSTLASFSCPLCSVIISASLGRSESMDALLPFLWPFWRPGRSFWMAWGPFWRARRPVWRLRGIHFAPLVVFLGALCFIQARSAHSAGPRVIRCTGLWCACVIRLWARRLANYRGCAIFGTELVFIIVEMI